MRGSLAQICMMGDRLRAWKDVSDKDIAFHGFGVAENYQRLPDRLRNHAAICFMALILYRVMRQRLKANPLGLSPERVLAQLQRVQHHRVHLNHKVQAGISTLNFERQQILAARGANPPTVKQQLLLL